MEFNNIELKEAIATAKQIAGVENRSGGNKQINNNNQPPKQKVQPKQSREEVEKEAQKAEFIRKQKIDFIKTNLDKQSPENKQKVYEYMQSRGFSKELADKYNLFISNEVYEDKAIGTEGTPRLVIPIYKDNEPISYVARALTEVDGRAKALNSAGEQTPLNIDYIKENPKDKIECIYICEGWADTFSFEEVGKKSIALHSTNQTSKLVESIQQHRQSANKYIYILSFDNDEAGRKASQTLAEFFSMERIEYKNLNIPEQYKDVNEWYKDLDDKEEFKRAINPFANETTLNYIDNNFLNDIEKMKEYKGRSTGFKNLDNEINGVIPGLYVLGAISSLGKTTFISQIADQMASKGEHIIFFSLEQSRFELVAKSISRQTCILNPKEAKTSLAIMQNTDVADITMRAVQEYMEIAHNSIIVEGNFNITVNSIRDYIRYYIGMTGIKPVVVLDYLQILRPINDRLTDKQQVDYNVTELKRISRDYDIPIFVICSFNRENYTQTVDFTSFKESGAIEYSADVVMGLQLAVMEELGNKTTENREKINNAKNETPRRVQLIGLKNRNGKSYFRCNFKYYPAFNFFEEADAIPTFSNGTTSRKQNPFKSFDDDLPF